MGERTLDVAVFNLDATHRPPALNTQDKLLAHLAARCPFPAGVAAYTEVSSVRFAQRIADARPGAAFAEHAFAAADRTVQVFPEDGSGARSGVSARGKYLYTPLDVGGQTVLLYTVHLSRRDAAARRRQLGLLVRSVETYGADAHEVVVCGDFNTPSGALLDAFAGTGLAAAIGPGDAPTAASGAIDNLLTSAPLGDVARWDGSRFTHTPFAATLRIQK